MVWQWFFFTAFHIWKMWIWKNLSTVDFIVWPSSTELSGASTKHLCFYNRPNHSGRYLSIINNKTLNFIPYNRKSTMHVISRIRVNFMYINLPRCYLKAPLYQQSYNNLRLHQSSLTHLHLILTSKCPSILQYTEHLIRGDSSLHSNPGPIHGLFCIATLFRCCLLEIKDWTLLFANKMWNIRFASKLCKRTTRKFTVIKCTLT